jgi:hypothetical protein
MDQTVADSHLFYRCLHQLLPCCHINSWLPCVEEKIGSSDLINETTLRIGTGLLGFYVASQGVLTKNPVLVHGGISVAADMADLVTNWALDSIDKNGDDTEEVGAGITYRPRPMVPC